MTRTVWLITFTLFLSGTAFIQAVFGQRLIISEASTGGTLFTKDFSGSNADWIELYNADSSDILLEDYYLTDNVTNPKKFKLPAISIPAHGRLLVFASGKDTVINGEIHANFKLNSSGETVQLSGPAGTISTLSCPEIPFNYSWGRTADTGIHTQLFDFPTPRESNLKSNVIILSHKPGLYSEGIAVSASASNGDTIRYTTDGTIPTINSSAMPESIYIDKHVNNKLSQVPTTPLAGKDYLDQFMWHEPAEDRFTGTVLTLASFKNGVQSSKTQTLTYIIDPESKTLTELPVIALTLDSTDMFGYSKGIYIPGETFASQEWIGYWPTGNYHTKNYIPVNAEIFEHGRSTHNSPAMMRTRGGGSVCLAQKSLKLNFKKACGGEGPSFDYLGKRNESYKTFILRNGGNDFGFTHFSEAFVQHTLSSLSLEIQASHPAHVYINGEYWGIFNIREPHDRHFFKRNFDVEQDELIIVGNCGKQDHGSNQAYDSLISFIETHPLSVAEHYAQIENKIDIDNCIDYFIAEIFCANYDWPGNNYRMWKSNKPDAKWRWLVYDLDIAWGTASISGWEKNSFKHVTNTEGSDSDWPNPPCSTLLFRELLKSSRFTDRFIDRFRYHLQYTFAPERTLATIDSFTDLYRPHMQYQINRWTYPESMDQWHSNINTLKAFAQNRPGEIASQIKDFFELDEFNYTCPETAHPQNQTGTVKVYPVPANTSISVETSTLVQHVALLNIGGQTIVEATPHSCHFSVDISSLTEGVYYLRTTSGQFSETVMFSKYADGK